ncbi:MAG: DUF4350 domain-containing protein [Syntrophobacteraceae bacterium]|nr:DUF4350 domain-containing protein [Desulfobacteraceae bacterium]
MRKTGRIDLLILAALACCLAAGFYVLFVSRFETGDVYSPYSSLRSDPLGTRALFQAIESTPGVSAQRHYRSLKKLEKAENATVLYLGLRPDFLAHPPPDTAVELEKLAERGARIVLAFLPMRTGAPCGTFPGKKGVSRKEPGGEEIPGTGPGNDADTREKKREIEPLAKRWKISPAFLSREEGTEGKNFRASLKSAESGLPGGILHRSTFCFDVEGTSWRVLYAVGEKPVIAERASGKGSIVLVADSYLFSNEAMRDEPHPSLLAWLIGPGSTVVFDEFHLGARENPTLMAYARKYRLHGFMGALCLIGLLLVWQRNAPFAPAPREDAGIDGGVAGKDHPSGLVHLLRRNIPRTDTLKICCDEWRRAAGRETAGVREKMVRVEAVLEAERNNPDKDRGLVQAYGKIADILSRRGQADE